MIIQDDRSITITGSRELSNLSPVEVSKTIDSTLSMWDTKDTHWFIGGALGIDTRVLNHLAIEGYGKITVVVPSTVDAQPIAAREAIIKAKTLRDIRIVELKDPLFPRSPAYHKRNRYMVDNSEIVIGFINTTARSEGTRLTLKYAEDNNKLVIRNPMGE